MENIILFDPTVEKLQEIVSSTSLITANDLSDDAQLAIVRGTRLQLRDARVTIQKQGKSMREDALKYQKDVIAREKELIGIIEPEEIRLKSLEEEATSIKERAARAALLPMRRDMLAKFDLPDFSDESVLSMDNDEFMAYLTDLQTEKNENDRIDNEKETARLAQVAREAQIAEDARIAERARAELAAQKLIDDAKDEVARAEADKLFIEWKLSNGWTEETADQYKTVLVDGAIELWKLVNIY